MINPDFDIFVIQILLLCGLMSLDAGMQMRRKRRRIEKGGRAEERAGNRRET